MGWNPLTRDQAEERLGAWIAEHVDSVDADDVTPWLRWDASDLAYVVDVEWPDDVRSGLPRTLTVPRFDLPQDRPGERDVVDGEVPTGELRLLIDRHTGEIAAAEAAEPVSHLLEVWRNAKSLADDGVTGSVPPYEEST